VVHIVLDELFEQQMIIFLLYLVEILKLRKMVPLIAIWGPREKKWQKGLSNRAFI
jgi:hypothetical protein